MTKTFRISEEALDALSEDARAQNVSMNTLVNQLLISYVEFDRWMRKVHLIKIAGSTLRLFFDGISPETAKAAGEEQVREMAETFILSHYGALTAESVLAYIRTISEHGGVYEYNEVTRVGSKTLTLLHELGMNGSIFISTAAVKLLAEVGIKADCKLSDGAVILTLAS